MAREKKRSASAAEFGRKLDTAVDTALATLSWATYRLNNTDYFIKLNH